MSKTTGRKADPANRTRLKAKAIVIRKTGQQALSYQPSAISQQGCRPPGAPLAGGSPTTPTAGVGGGGGERDRTDDLLLAKQALSQLSYTPGSRRPVETEPEANGDPWRPGTR